MVGYKSLTLIQTIFILLTGISVLDFGLELATTLESDPTKLGFNEALFEDSDNEWWSVIVFWGYNFLAVGVLQLIKAFSKD